MAEALCHKAELLRIDHPLSEHSVVTISVGGCSMIPQGDHLADRLLKRADKAEIGRKPSPESFLDYAMRNKWPNSKEFAKAPEPARCIAIGFSMAPSFSLVARSTINSDIA